MSDTPERIWAWNPDNYTKKVGFETQSGNKETTEYIRADIHEALISYVIHEVIIRHRIMWRNDHKIVLRETCDNYCIAEDLIEEIDAEIKSIMESY